MEQELLLAAVDLGSNSFRVEIGRIVNGRALSLKITGRKQYV